MSTARQRDRCRDRLERLSSSSVRGEALQRETVVELQHVIGFDRWCWPTGDPQSLVPGSGLAYHDYGPGVPRALELEFAGGDFATKAGLARHPWPVGSLHADTGGDLARSPRWSEVLHPVGIGDTATLACRDAHGCWGWLDVHRDSSDRPFDDADLALLSDLASVLGTALRRELAELQLSGAADPSPAGSVLLDEELKVLDQTVPARHWIDLLPAAPLFASWGILPPPIYPVGALARDGATDGAHTVVATSGSWVSIEAAPLAGHRGQVIITLRAASPAETIDLVTRAHGLTPRERQIIGLLVAGLDTRAITHRLGISPHTVQDHLKSAFAKLGVSSRRQLVAKVQGLADPDLLDPAAPDPGPVRQGRPARSR